MNHDLEPFTVGWNWIIEPRVFVCPAYDVTWAVTFDTWMSKYLHTNDSIAHGQVKYPGNFLWICNWSANSQFSNRDDDMSVVCLIVTWNDKLRECNIIIVSNCTRIKFFLKHRVKRKIWRGIVPRTPCLCCLTLVPCVVCRETPPRTDPEVNEHVTRQTPVSYTHLTLPTICSV